MNIPYPDNGHSTALRARNEQPADGSASAVAGNFAEILHDVTELAELQGKLLAADAQATMRRAIIPVVLIVVGVCLLLGCLPVVLTAAAQLINDSTELSLAVSLAISSGVGLLLAAILVIFGWKRLRGSIEELDRSRDELSRNIAWLKQSLKRRKGGLHQQSLA